MFSSYFYILDLFTLKIHKSHVMLALEKLNFAIDIKLNI